MNNFSFQLDMLLYSPSAKRVKRAEKLLIAATFAAENLEIFITGAASGVGTTIVGRVPVSGLTGP